MAIKTNFFFGFTKVLAQFRPFVFVKDIRMNKHDSNDFTRSSWRFFVGHFKSEDLKKFDDLKLTLQKSDNQACNLEL